MQWRTNASSAGGISRAHIDLSDSRRAESDGSDSRRCSCSGADSDTPTASAANDTTRGALLPLPPLPLLAPPAAAAALLPLLFDIDAGALG